jgi:hypothetical protein
MSIINLTQHAASPEQLEAGVLDLTGDALVYLRKELTFSYLPDAEAIDLVACYIARLAEDAEADAAMIGGAPFLMAPLETYLREKGIKPVYAFSKRETFEEIQKDGSTRKVNIFRHLGFVGED